MAANEYEISAGLVPIDNSTGATVNSYYIAAGLIPTDTSAAPETITTDKWHPALQQPYVPKWEIVDY